jgi:hypothetical protein
MSVEASINFNTSKCWLFLGDWLFFGVVGFFWGIGYFGGDWFYFGFSKVL